MRTLRLALAGLLAALGLVTLAAAPSHACSCVTGTPAQHLRWTDSVFTGTLTDIAPPPQRHVMSSTDPNTYTFDVDQSFEGDHGPRVQVKSAMSGASCGLQWMQVDVRYLVYATSKDGELWASLCGGTAPVKQAPIDRIARLSQPSPLLWSPPPALLRILAF
jgi:hypothetical protein